MNIDHDVLDDVAAGCVASSGSFRQMGKEEIREILKKRIKMGRHILHLPVWRLMSFVFERSRLCNFQNGYPYLSFLPF